MHDVASRRLRRGPRKRHSEPAANIRITEYDLLLLGAHSLPEITTSQHQLFVEYCSDSHGVGTTPLPPRCTLRATQRGSIHTLLRTPPRSPCASSPSTQFVPFAAASTSLLASGRSPRHPHRQPKDRRRSLGVPGSRSPNGRRIWREMNQLEDPWSEFHRQRSPATTPACISQIFDEKQGYRCRSFSVTSKGVVVNLGEVLLNADDERRKSTSSCPNGPEETAPLHRVRLVGASGVGKSCLIQQFIEGASATPGQNIVTSPPTSGENSLETQSTRVLLDGEECEVEFEETTDTRVSRQQLEEVDAFVVIFSVTDSESMDLAEDVISRLRALCGSRRHRRKSSGAPSSSPSHAYLNRPITKAIILVANKVDLARRRIVSKDEARSVAKRYECKFIETSACIGHNVDELLVGTLKQIRLKQRSDSVPAWCALAGHVPLGPALPLPTIQLPSGELPDSSVYDPSYEYSISPSPLPSPSPIATTAVAHRSSVARIFCGKARGFFTLLWTKCDAVKTRSCDDLHVL